MSKSVVLYLSDSVMAALDELAARKGLSKQVVLNRALQLYMAVDVRQQHGEELYYKEDGITEIRVAIAE